MSVGRAFGDEMTGQSDIIISCHDSPKSTTRSRLLADSRGVTCHRHRHHPQHVVVLRWGLWTILGLLVRNTMSSSKLTVLGFSSSDLRRTSTIRRQASRYGLMKPTSYSSVTESSKNVVIRTASAKDLVSASGVCFLQLVRSTNVVCSFLSTRSGRCLSTNPKPLWTRVEVPLWMHF